MNKIWRIKESNHEKRASLAKPLGISPITAQLLINRGIEDEMQAHHFLYGDLASCHDPNLLKDIRKAVSRIERALKDKENILLYGDYDVDGITSVALLYRVFTFLGAGITTYIPNRIEEGYGLNVNAVKFARKKKIGLIITADCGIGAHEEVKLANEYGIDVIVTDHHEIKSSGPGKEEVLPRAFAVINPLQKGCAYPFKHLSGVGLVYKLAEVLLKDSSYPLQEDLDLVALGTVSDLAPQMGENRMLTREGLKILSATKKKGINALIKVSGIRTKGISSRHIGYILGPRINAMGRIGSPEVSLKLLITDDEKEAERLAGILNRENRNRQKIEADVLDRAMEKIEREVNFKDTRVVVVAGEGWHPGVIGIVASRIVDKFYRPAIVISLAGKIGKGSGRSIENFHLFNAVNSCKKYLADFGGHEGACGLAVEKNNIGKFREEINRVARGIIKDRDLYPTLDIDLEVPLSDLSESLIKELELLQPFGPENPRPVFTSKDLYLRQEPRKLSRNGLKMWVTDDIITCEAVSFRAGGMGMPVRGAKVNVVYSPSINTWQGLSSLQLDLKDFKLL